MVRTLEFVEKLNDNLLGTICDYALRLAEAKDRATAAEEELAIQSWRAEENLRCWEVTNEQLAAEQKLTAYWSAKAVEDREELYVERRKAQDMEYRAQNAEVNARYYWKELQSEQAKSRMYKQERDYERKRYDELSAGSIGSVTIESPPNVTITLPVGARGQTYNVTTNAGLGG